MFISVFDIFKIGIGPSSSHTMGPMTAAVLFLEALKETGQIGQVHRIQSSLHGSLAFTGKGHATDRAVCLGLAGYSPETIDSSRIADLVITVCEQKTISPPGFPPIVFDPQNDLIFDYGPPLAGHANGLKFFAYQENHSLILHQTYYSIGGGFVVLEGDLASAKNDGVGSRNPSAPYPFKTALEMLALGKDHDISIAEMKMENELTHCGGNEFEERLDYIWQVMSESIDNGLKASGILPGGLNLGRRAKGLYQQIQKQMKSENKPPMLVNEWLALTAMAVNEENANGGKIVTAPTNGAAGVVPAVINYYLTFYPDAQKKDVRDFLLVAAAIGGIIKHNGSISGAEVGCQGEIGSASAMAAAGLCAVLGGTNEQIENAAEIALEHHLGMTCDPVNGLVQIPCIERNGFGAVKAATAASLALRGDGSHLVSLDKCIKTMYETGLDMHTKYKETSQGGLAVNMVDC